MSIWPVREFISRNKAAVAQGLSSVLILVWFILNPSPEPAVAFLMSALATYLAFRQSAATWRGNIRGALYEIHYRGLSPTETEKVPAYLMGHAFIVKWKIIHHDGEFKTLVLDSLDEISVSTVRTVTSDCRCKLYSVMRDGKKLWESET